MAQQAHCARRPRRLAPTRGSGLCRGRGDRPGGAIGRADDGILLLEREAHLRPPGALPRRRERAGSPPDVRRRPRRGPRASVLRAGNAGAQAFALGMQGKPSRRGARRRDRPEPPLGRLGAIGAPAGGLTLEEPGRRRPDALLLRALASRVLRGPALYSLRVPASDPGRGASGPPTRHRERRQRLPPGPVLLLSFVYARPSSVLLLDEPDAPLHFILQRELTDHRRQVAHASAGASWSSPRIRRSFSRESDPQDIVSFVGPRPRRLLDAREQQRLADALQTLTSMDLVQGRQVGAVLYVEDESDYKILRQWAEILGHDAARFLKFPYVVPLRGKGNLNVGRRHFECLRLAFPDVKGTCVVDSDMDAPWRQRRPRGAAGLALAALRDRELPARSRDHRPLPRRSRRPLQSSHPVARPRRGAGDTVRTFPSARIGSAAPRFFAI